jgi:hypothetical protein
MQAGVYLYYSKVQLWYLKWFGWLVGFGTFPVHSFLCVKLAKSGYCMKVELTSDPPNQNTRIVGRGDGYTIQITTIDEKEVCGDFVPNCSPLAILETAERYASTKNGDLTYSSAERDWYKEPQGYGGPMFDRSTCNTFTYYILKKSSVDGKVPSKPKGAIGWGLDPKFPGPQLS